MTSNTLTTEFNTSPYYDDYDEDKNYYRILFRPSVAVQARELTQLQTMLQTQIDRFGEHVFKEGSLVLGGQSVINDSYRYLRVKDNNSLSQNVTISNFANTTLTSNISGVTATVLGYQNGSEAQFPTTKTLFVRITNSGSNNTANNFAQGEELTSNSGFKATLLANSSYAGNGYFVSINEGVLFAKDHFIKFPAQSLVVNAYSTAPTTKIGFLISEDIVTSSEDSSLLDNAQGSFNFAAPGAHRLKLTATLTTANSSNTSSDFIVLYDIKNGTIQEKADLPEYSVIKDEWARRTYDESGNYAVRGLKCTLKEHLNDGENNGLLTSQNGGNSSLLAVAVSPGKGYVLGYDVDKYTTSYVVIDKALDYDNLEQQSISANYGNYILVDELVGHLNVNDGVTVNLYDAAENRISTLGYSSTSPSGNLIGTAKAKALTYESGTKGLSAAQYRLYLYDIQMTSNTFSNVKSVYYNNPSTADFGCDAVLTANTNTLKEVSFNRSIFEIPIENIRKIRDESDLIDTTYQFQKGFTVAIGTGGTFSVSTGASDETFPFSTGALNSTQKRSNFFVSLDSATTVSLTGTVTTNSNTTVSGSGTNFDTSLKAGDKITVNGQTKIIDSVSSDTLLFTTDAFANSSAGDAIVKQYSPGDIIDFSVTGATGNDRTITVATSTSASFDMKETLTSGVNGTVVCNLNKVDGREIAKTYRQNRLVQINCGTHVANNTGPWNLGFSDVFKINSVRKHTAAFSSTSLGSDVSSHFELDDGQRDNYYGHAKLKKKASSSLSIGASDYLLVDLDYFYHDFSQGKTYFSIDSYPIDDANTSNTSAIQTKEIPIYISPTTGVSYNLRDSIDTRPSRSATATDATVVGSMSTNPANTASLNVPTGGLRTPTPNENFLVDLSYYLRRKDAITITKTGLIKAIKGVPSSLPRTPETPSDSMTLAVIDVAPYPSLPPKIAQIANRPDYACGISDKSYKRYTMRDIGLLDQRLKNVEDYVALSLLEKDTLDLKIPDENGLDRFKNGILVDPFKDHSIGDNALFDYNCAVDRVNNELRPKFTMNDIKSKYSASSTNVTRHTNDVVTLPYTSVEFASQPFATTNRNTAGAFYSYQGNLVLDPNVDYWVDTNQIPDLTITDNSAIAFYQTMADALTSDWNSWQTVWSGSTSSSSQQGNRLTTTTSTTSRQTSTREVFKVNNLGVSTQSYGDRVVDVALQPYIRSREVKITATGLKPGTTSFVYFDGTNVSSYVTPANSSFSATGTEGSGIVTDTDGTFYGILRIPNDDTLRFTVGNKPVVITDSVTNSDDSVSQAEAQYSSQGVTQTVQETIVSTAQAELVSQTETRTRTINSSSSWTTFAPVRNAGGGIGSSGLAGNGRGREPSDPLGQTFYVSVPGNVEGIFASKIDLYFQSKHATYGAIVEIRETDNLTGYITNKILPYSRVRIPSSAINVSSDGTTATTVNFGCPIFLLNDTNYAIVIKPEANNQDTALWVAKLGQDDLNTGARVQKQPYTGVLFVSSNNRTWNAIQDEDIKFTLYRASFSTNVTGDLRMTNEDVDYFNIANVSSAFSRMSEVIHGESRLTLSSITGGSIANGYSLVGTTSGANGVVVSSSGAVYRLKQVTLDNKFASSESVTVNYANGTSTGITATVDSIAKASGRVEFYTSYDSSNTVVYLANSTGDFIVGEELRGQTSNNYATIESINDMPYSLIDIESSFLRFNNTEIDWFAKTTAADTLASAFSSIIINDNNDFTQEKEIRSRSNESGTKSLQLKTTMSTLSDFVSPVVDINRSHNIFIYNLINNDTTDETNVNGGNAKTRYITQTVTLAEDQDAEDLIVRLTAYKPAASDVKVYYKILNAEDADTLTEDISWVEMSQSTKTSVFSNSANKDDFIEFEYAIPTANLTGANEEVQYTNSEGVVFTGFKYFKLKVVLLSTSTTEIPRLRDLRCIALQK